MQIFGAQHLRAQRDTDLESVLKAQFDAVSNDLGRLDMSGRFGQDM